MVNQDSRTGGCMTDSAIATTRRRRLLARAPLVAALLAGAAFLLLVLVPFGWRFGLWNYRLSFQMVAWAQDLALAGAAVAALGLVFGRSLIGGRGRVAARVAGPLGRGYMRVAFFGGAAAGAAPADQRHHHRYGKPACL